VFSVLSGVIPRWGLILSMTLPVLSMAVGFVFSSASDSTDIGIPVEHLAVLGVSQFILMAAWYVHRPSKLCNLLETSPTENGVSLATAFSFLAAVQTKGSDETMLMLLVGSLSMTIMYVYLGAVADVWYTVGTGQFWMVSLDSSSLIVYLFAPILILVGRFNEKYGEAVHEATVSLCKSMVANMDVPSDPETILSSAVVMILALGTVVGIPFLKSLCPIGGHFLGRAYTHGQQSTRKVALLLSWQYKDLIAEISKKSILVNLLVTGSDLEADGDKIKKAVDLGHGTVIRGDVSSGYDQHMKLVGKAPVWYHGEGMVVARLAEASKREMRICLWSSSIQTSTAGVDPLLEDVEASLGGNIVYVEDFAPQSVVTEFIEKVTAKGYTFAPLCQVAKPDLPMRLTTHK